MGEKVLLKDALFNKAKVARIAAEIRAVHPEFAEKTFVSDCVAEFPSLELKARIAWIAACLKKHLPAAYPRAVEVLLAALPPPNDPALGDDDFGEFIYAPYADFVAKNGCSSEHLERSLAALYQITQRFSTEDAIRYFINAFPQQTLRALAGWTRDSHYHVRRLCSEGTRPKLPWSQKIRLPVSAPVPLLDELYADNTRFVTRSVANHINDIGKIDPDLALATLARWKASGKQRPREMDYIVRHGLRTLIKMGNAQAMAMLGFHAAPGVGVTGLRAPEAVAMNTALEFEFNVRADAATNVLIDYILHFRNKAGKLQGRKVYKLCKLALEADAPVAVSKRHMLRGDMTTRTLYPGRHALEIQVNGTVAARAEFDLVASAR